MGARVGLAAIVAAALALAWWLRWGCDDAFITYVYSRNLVYGDGLTWFGDRIEGYTNFLWVLWNAVGIALGLPPLAWSWIGGLAAMVVALVTTYRLVLLRTSDSTPAALAGAGLLATSYTFIAFATGGLETMLQCALLVVALFEVDRMRRGEPVSPRRLAGLSVVAALALWTRLDSAVYLAIVGVAALVHLLRSRAPRGHYIAVIAPAFVLVGGWLAWKLVYYGDVLPNTFHAKVEVTSHTLWAATRFAASFFHTYALWPALALGGVLAVVRRSYTARLPLAIVIAWVAYVISVGGDFMEYRFFVPILPPLAVVIAETVVAASAALRSWAPPVAALALVTTLAVFSRHHGKTFDGSKDMFFDSVGKMATFYGLVADNDWSRIGTRLGDQLAETGAILASNGAGAIPYFSDLPTVDQLGLNDRWVARHGSKADMFWARPGHQRFATHAYLRERGVNFVVGTPRTVPRGRLHERVAGYALVSWIQMLLGPSPIESDSVRVVAAPVDDQSALLLWYLTPTPVIDERIRSLGWEMREVRRR